jgi:CBS domain-containing protein
MYRGKYRHLLVRGRRGKIIGIVSMRRILSIAVELGQGMSETRTIGDIATAEMIMVQESMTVFETVELMNRRGVAAVVVNDDQMKPCGIFTERDVLKRVATRDLDLETTTVNRVMTEPVITMPPTALVGNVLAEMHRRDIRNMPLCGTEGVLTGLVSMPEVLQYAQAFNIDEQVRRTWKEVADYLDSEDQYTPG